MTSNLGSGLSDEGVMNAVRSHFKPEFVNRVDEIVIFHRLSEEHIATIVGIQIELLRARMAGRGLDLELTAAARDYVARTGYDPDYGARPLKRVLQKEVADPIAIGILSGRFAEGAVVHVDASPDGGLTFA